MRPAALAIAALTACGVFASVVPAQAAVRTSPATAAGIKVSGIKVSGIKVSGGTYRAAPAKVSGGTYRKLTPADGTYKVAGGTYRSVNGGTYR